MTIMLDLPEVAEAAKPGLQQQAKEWDATSIRASLGMRFAMLLEIMERYKTFEPTAENTIAKVLAEQQRLVAEALYRHAQMRDSDLDDLDDLYDCPDVAVIDDPDELDQNFEMQ